MTRISSLRKVKRSLSGTPYLPPKMTSASGSALAGTVLPSAGHAHISSKFFERRNADTLSSPHSAESCDIRRALFIMNLTSGYRPDTKGPQIVLQLFANIERAMNAAFSTCSSDTWHDHTIQ
jgi:hypothetical protein